MPVLSNNQGLKFDIAIASRPGGDINQDSTDAFVAVLTGSMPEQRSDPVQFAVIADGVNGAPDGDKASSLAVTGIRESLNEPKEIDIAKRMKSAIEKANLAIFDVARSNPASAGMSSTVTLAAIQNDQLWVAHIGDSRAYLIRNGQAHLLTRDHTRHQEILDAGGVPEADSNGVLPKQQLTRRLGRHERVDVDQRIIDLRQNAEERLPEERLRYVSLIHLRSGDALLLCTDGLSGSLNASRIAEIVSQNRSSKAAAERLVQEAKTAGSKDDISALIVRYPTAGLRWFLSILALALTIGILWLFISRPTHSTFTVPPTNLITNNNQPIFAGTALAGQVVTVTIGPAMTLTTSVDSSGQWSVSAIAPLADGIYTPTVTSWDFWGFLPGIVTGSAFTVDTQAPKPPQLTSPADGAKLNQEPLLFSGSGEPGSIIILVVDSTVFSAPVSSDGSWQIQIAQPLKPETYPIEIAAADSLGNTSKKSTVIISVQSEPSPTPVNTLTPTPVVTDTATSEPSPTLIATISPSVTTASVAGTPTLTETVEIAANSKTLPTVQGTKESVDEVALVPTEIPLTIPTREDTPIPPTATPIPTITSTPAVVIPPTAIPSKNTEATTVPDNLQPSPPIAQSPNDGKEFFAGRDTEIPFSWNISNKQTPLKLIITALEPPYTGEKYSYSLNAGQLTYPQQIKDIKTRAKHEWKICYVFADGTDLCSEPRYFRIDEVQQSQPTIPSKDSAGTPAP